MKNVQQALAAYLAAETGAAAVEEKSRCRVYPSLVVTVRENGVTLLAGGALAEHAYAVTVVAVSDRERQGATALLDAVTAALLRGVPMGERVLHPANIVTQGDTLTCALALCLAVPSRGTEETALMETVHLAF